MLQHSENCNIRQILASTQCGMCWQTHGPDRDIDMTPIAKWRCGIRSATKAVYIVHTEANTTDVSSIWSNIDWWDNSDHEIDDVLPVVLCADVVVANAAGMINDERNVQQTCWMTQRKTMQLLVSHCSLQLVSVNGYAGIWNNAFESSYFTVHKKTTTTTIMI